MEQVYPTTAKTDHPSSDAIIEAFCGLYGCALTYLAEDEVSGMEIAYTTFSKV